jgi:uncharacterized protein YhjY with autotransporter beta-barrel domain
MIGLGLLSSRAQANGATYSTTQSGATSGATQNWDDGSAWTRTAGSSSYSYPNGAQDEADFQPIATSGTIVVDGSFSMQTIHFFANSGATPGSWTLAGTGSLTGIASFENESTAPLTISASLHIGNPVTAGTDVEFDLVGGSTTTVTGVIADELSLNGLTLGNNGTIILDAANTYSDGTAFQSGTLIAGNSSAVGTGTFNFMGGTLAMGNGNHTLALSNYTQSGGTLTLSVAGTGQAATADKLVITNSSAATLGGALDVNLGSFVRGGSGVLTFTLLSTTDGYTGTFTSDFIGLGSGLTANLDYTADDVLLQINEGASGFSLAGLTPEQQGIVAPINRLLLAGSPSPALASLTAALAPLSASPSTFGAALEQLSPKEFGRFTSETAFNNASFETQEMDDYLAGRRDSHGTFLGGSGRLDTSGLTVNDPSYDPALAVVHSRLLAWEPSTPRGGVLSDVPSALVGGVDMKEMKSAAIPAESDPWNFYVRGNVILAQGFSQPTVAHFDDNTESVEAGADYRLTPNLLVGLTAGYAHTDATLDPNGTSATVDSYSPGLYASYADKGWYADLTGDYVHNAYTQARTIGFLNQTATSAPEGDEGVVNLDGGRDFHLGAFTLGPLAGLQYTHLTVNSYTENNSVADLSVNEQDDDSLRSRLGGHLSYNLSQYGVNFRPHLDATWQHEFMDQSRGITSQFNNFGGGSFSVRTESPDRDFALADAGVDVDINRTITVFTDYMLQAGQSNYFGQSVQAGVKIGF